MKTKFKLQFIGKPDIELNKFQSSLPPDFTVAEKKDGIYVEIKSSSSEDERCQRLIDRELDRHFFLTCVRIHANMVRKRVYHIHEQKYSIHGSLPDNINPQNWNYELPIQLRLWAVATEHQDVITKLLLLFQIIELSYPNTNDQRYYPLYSGDPTIPPEPTTECKFIRHLIAHSGDVTSAQLKLYCEHLQMPEVTLDITDKHYFEVISSKVSLMENEAKNVINNSLHLLQNDHT